MKRGYDKTAFKAKSVSSKTKNQAKAVVQGTQVHSVECPYPFVHQGAVDTQQLADIDDRFLRKSGAFLAQSHVSGCFGQSQVRGHSSNDHCSQTRAVEAI